MHIKYLSFSFVKGRRNKRCSGKHFTEDKNFCFFLTSLYFNLLFIACVSAISKVLWTKHISFDRWYRVWPYSTSSDFMLLFWYQDKICIDKNKKIHYKICPGSFLHFLFLREEKVSIFIFEKINKVIELTLTKGIFIPIWLLN